MREDAAAQVARLTRELGAARQRVSELESESEAFRDLRNLIERTPRDDEAIAILPASEDANGKRKRHARRTAADNALSTLRLGFGHAPTQDDMFNLNKRRGLCTPESMLKLQDRADLSASQLTAVRQELTGCGSWVVRM